jgi:hypothetical protein
LSLKKRLVKAAYNVEYLKELLLWILCVCPE